MSKQTWKDKFIIACKKTMTDEFDGKHYPIYCTICNVARKADNDDNIHFHKCDYCIQPNLKVLRPDSALLPCQQQPIEVADLLRPIMWSYLIPMLEKVHGRHFTPNGDKSVFEALWIEASKLAIEEGKEDK